MKTPEQLKGAIHKLAKEIYFKRWVVDFRHPWRSGTNDNGYGHDRERLANG